MTTYDRLSRRMDREAQGSLFDYAAARTRIALASAIEAGDPRYDAHLREIDAEERAHGGKWQLSDAPLHGEIEIRDERFTDIGRPDGDPQRTPRP